VPVFTAGPYVETGTFRVQVADKLGRPAAVLPDGTWLFNRHRIENSNATGTLVVQFIDGRVSALTLMKSDRAATLRAGPREPLAMSRIAKK
jgi:hypothetical protein